MEFDQKQLQYCVNIMLGLNELTNDLDELEISERSTLCNNSVTDL